MDGVCSQCSKLWGQAERDGATVTLPAACTSERCEGDGVTTAPPAPLASFE